MSKLQLRKLGADPEVFLFDPNEEIYVPAIDLIGGSKANPRSIGKGHAVQEDNVMAEFNIPPAETAEEFAESIQFVLGYLSTHIPQPLELQIIPSCEFLPEMLTDPQACVSGCDPYINAWTGDIDEAIDLSTTNERYAGAHIHIEYDNPDKELTRDLVRNLDLTLGVPSILIDDDENRRKHYGKAGAHRIKPYGFEYRSLSNFWIKTEKRMKWVFRNANLAFDLYNDGIEAPDDVRVCINESNKKMARELIDKFNIPY